MGTFDSDHDYQQAHARAMGWPNPNNNSPAPNPTGGPHAAAEPQPPQRPAEGAPPLNPFIPPRSAADEAGYQVSGEPDDDSPVDFDSYAGGYGMPPVQQGPDLSADDLTELVRRIAAQSPETVRAILDEHTSQPPTQTLPPHWDQTTTPEEATAPTSGAPTPRHSAPLPPWEVARLEQERNPTSQFAWPATPVTRAGAPSDTAPAKPTRPRKQHAADREGAARRGWRGWTVDHLNIFIRKSAAEEHVDLMNLAAEAVRTALDEPLVFVVTSFKGGCGKTPMAVSLALEIAHQRHEPVLALDVDLHGTLLARAMNTENIRPDSGTMMRLAARLVHYKNQPIILGQYLHQATADFFVIPGNQFGQAAELSAQGYTAIIAEAKKHFQVIIVDMSQVKESELYDAALKSADGLVLVTPPRVVATEFLNGTNELLRKHDAEHLLSRRVTLINNDKRPTHNIDIAALAESIKLSDQKGDEHRTPAEVIEVPFDAHINRDTEIDRDQLATRTRESILQSAAALFEAVLELN